MARPGFTRTGNNIYSQTTEVLKKDDLSKLIRENIVT